MTQSWCKRDPKSKSHPSVKLAPVRVFSCKRPLRYLLSILAINFTAFPWLQFSKWGCTVCQNRYCEVIYEMFHILNADLKLSQLWSSQLWTQFKQLRIVAWKSQDFNGVWTRDLAIPVRRSNHASIRNCLNCVHNCDDHSWLENRYYKAFVEGNFVFAYFHNKLHQPKV